MKYATDFFSNPAIISAMLSWFLAQFLKPVVNFFFEKRFDWLTDSTLT